MNGINPKIVDFIKKINEKNYTMKITKESLDLTRKISDEINNQTFHHHYHILYDIAQSYEKAIINNKKVIFIDKVLSVYNNLR